MVFVDGENFTLRAQDVMKNNDLEFTKPEFYEKDTFCWFPKSYSGKVNKVILPIQHTKWLASEPIRAYYYTTCSGELDKVDSVRHRLYDIGFHANVFQKKKNKKAKAVDIALCTDMLGHAYRNNYDTAVLFAGDGDFEPLVDEVKRLGKNVFVAFFESNGLNKKLKLAADGFMNLDKSFPEMWQNSGPSSPAK